MRLLSELLDLAVELSFGLSSAANKTMRPRESEENVATLISCGVDQETAYNMASIGLDTDAIDS